MMTQEEIQARLSAICTMVACAQEDTIRLMKALEQFSVPGPSKGKRKDPLSQEEINKILANRLRTIDYKNQ